MPAVDDDNFLAQPIHSPVHQEVSVVPDGTTMRQVAKKIVERNRNKKDWDETFLLGDIGILLEQFKGWKKELPRVEPFFAVKANALHPIVSTLAALGCGNDSASKKEITIVLECGVNPDDVIFAHPCKLASHITYARDNDVRMMTFDNEEELKKVKKLFPRAKLVLRIETDDSEARTQFKGKFGASVSEGKKLIEMAKVLEVEIIGISFHVGSGCPSDESYCKAIEDSKTLFDFACDVGFQFSFLDIGGGYPGTEEHETIRPFKNTTSVIRKALDEHFPVGSGVRIIAEPGRYFPGPAMEIVTNVFGKKITEDKVYYGIGESVFSAFSAILLEGFHFHPQLLEDKGRLPRESTIVGNCLDGSDVIVTSTQMPEVEVGDWITWKDVGGYSAFTRLGFHGFTTHKACYFITESKLKELRSLCVHPNLLPPMRDEI